ncbi:fructosamine kinase PKL/CAK/FruK [Punctularia strigosozonata HHB-11173 SS5]|uniref:fructosamine kinase PKL/CAK/FruK n=1 Tax=Punctularia strigosozonata (strain HHB-11173) TaxID=741275 RepID=UPI0004418558|nr:fructosamine kinase PKL/CAK/FruK [Punctularia strigosozonata HHB-11173 SS5]EIN13985.1 fructosamine kinase PKL/CAK/FruK [Punctularia strigosozonata HHB-11173 SS5]
MHPVLLKHLKTAEPGETFEGSFPRIRSSSGRSYYAKLGSPRDAEQWRGEAESLRAMDKAAPGLAPRLLAFGLLDGDVESSDGNMRSGRPFFLSEYKDMSSLTEVSGKALGRRLATEMHAYKSSEGFGFGVPTYCGATRLSNGWHETWEACYDAMIGELLGYLREQGGFKKLVETGDRVRKAAIPRLLHGLDIQPVLLHGDLWSGNTGTDRSSGQPIIFDPASYYGHNEADLAIARMFGGLPRSFFSAYHEHRPKTDPADQYEVRMDLYEMFHYLNHTVLFGGGYARSAQQKMDRVLAACMDTFRD